MEALTKSNGSGSAPKRQGKVQAESTRRKMRKKEEDIKMDIWLRLPQELIWEILCFVVGSYPDHNHQKCFTRCFKSTLASKLELKKKYETGQTISESEFTIIEYRLACPIWGIGHLSQVNVNFEMHHCECSLPSSLHQTLNKPSKVTIGQLTLTDSGIRRWKKTMYGAKVVIKNFGQVKENASKESSSGVAAKESEDEGEEEDPKVCYNGHDLQEVFQHTCGKVSKCQGGLVKHFGTRDFEHYLEREAEDRVCERCAESKYNERESYFEELAEERRYRAENRRWR